MITNTVDKEAPEPENDSSITTNNAFVKSLSNIDYNPENFACDISEYINTIKSEPKKFPDKSQIESILKFGKKNNKIFEILKFVINIKLIDNNENKAKKYIDFDEFIIDIFKETFTEEKIKSDSIYKDIIFYMSDYLFKDIISTHNLNLVSKYIQRTCNEKIVSLYLLFSYILLNLCKFSLIEYIEPFMNQLKSNKFQISSNSINSYIDFLCKSNRLEECQSFFEEFIKYKPELIIPITQNNINNTKSNEENSEIKTIYEKHISSFGINIISFGIFLKYLCKTDHLDLALFYFDQLCNKNLLKDEIIFNLVLNGCSKKGDFENLYRVYNEMLNNGIKPTIITLNTIIDAFIRNEEIENAWKVFEEMKKNEISPDNFTLSTLFRGIKSQEHYKYLIKGIEIVKNKTDQIDIILINVLLDACIKLKNEKGFIELFNDLINGKFKNLQPDLITYNTYIKGCSQLKLYDKVDYAYDHLFNHSKNDINEKKIEPNDVTFNSLIDAYIRQNNMEKVFKLISIMHEFHIKPDNFTYTTIIKGLNKDSLNKTNINTDNNSNNQNNENPSELDLAFKLFEHVRQNSKPDEILYNCIMDACLRFNKVDKMLELYKEMLEMNIKPSSVTCGIIIKAYGMKGDLNSALQVYYQMKKDNIPISNVTYGCLINVCIKNNNINKVFELYESLSKEGIEMNTILYTTLIKAYSKIKNLPKILEIFEKMKNSQNYKPNIITYNTIIDCCIKCHNFQLAYNYYDDLLKNLKPDIVTFSTLIKGEIQTNKNFPNARKLLDNMLKFDYIKLDCILLNTLLDGCEKCGYYNEAKELFNLFKSKNVEMNMMTYSILMKIYGLLNDYDGSVKLLQEINSNKNIKMNLIIITCFIKTCFSTNHIKEAIELFVNLGKDYNIKGDNILYSTVLNGIMSTKIYDIVYDKEIINIVKKSVDEGIILQNKNYNKVIYYLRGAKKFDETNELIEYLKENQIFDYYYSKNKYNNMNYINEVDSNSNSSTKFDSNSNENVQDNYEGNNNKFNNDYNKKRKPFKQIYNNNYGNNHYNYVYGNNKYYQYHNNDCSNNLNNSTNNNYTNYKWKNSYNNFSNRDKVYYPKK